MNLITKNDLIKAKEALRNKIKRTPIITSSEINDLCGCKVYFKCENFQKTGSFKARGAFNAVIRETQKQKINILATHSSGNHAAALAYVGKFFGIRTVVVMPSNSSDYKKKNVLKYGGEIIECLPGMENREKALKEFLQNNPALVIHPYDNEEVITGQSVCAQEIFEDLHTLDALLAPIGGGGLISGSCLASFYFSNSTKIYGAEPAGADEAFRSKKSGILQKNLQANSIADGLLANLSERTFGIINRYVEDIFLVDEYEIMNSLIILFENLKIVVEPSSCVPFAALLKNKHLFSGKNVCIILSGGNISPERFCELQKNFKEKLL